MPKHIGIVACSAEGASLCYSTICIEAAEKLGRHAHPEVSMHGHSFSDYVRLMEAGAWDGVAALMLSSEEKLEKAGAEIVICPDNTIHRVFDQVKSKARLPWLHIAEEVAKDARKVGYAKVGVLGTSYTMESDVYARPLKDQSIQQEIPDKKDRELIDKIIFDELVVAQFTSESRRYFNAVMTQLKDRGCEAIVLGCTEIPLIVEEESAPLPVLDSTRLLARAALRNAIT